MPTSPAIKEGGHMFFYRRHYLQSLLILLLVLTIPLTGALGSEGAAEKVLEAELMTEIIELIEKSYIEEVDRTDLIQSAIDGLLESLDDPYTSYLTPEEFEDLQIHTRGVFSGIGIEVTPDEETDQVIIVSPIQGTPGYEAGLEAGDQIVKIDGTPTDEIEFRTAVDMMRGEEGTTVELIIERQDQDEYLNFTIERAQIEIPNVESELERDDIAYIRINAFNEGVGRELQDEIAGLKEEVELRGIVLDLRANPGGILPEAVAVSSNFIADGVIVNIKDRDGVQDSLKSDPRIEAVDHPLVVLVDFGSASASEIVASAIQDHSRGITLGVKTFGKASVQSVFPLHEEMGAVSLTVASYYTPDGRPIHEEGIEPDIRVEINEDDEEDVQLKSALELISVLSRMGK